MNAWTTAGGLLGGIGLFLLGMGLMTDGLKLAAGPALGRILAHSTKTRMRGLASGVMVTALVQSSSAVTVAIIGFVNAGLLTLGHRGIHDLIEPCVLELNDQAFTRAVSLGAGNPLAATVERLATWALWCVTNGREKLLAPLLGRLGYL